MVETLRFKAKGKFTSILRFRLENVCSPHPVSSWITPRLLMGSEWPVKNKEIVIIEINKWIYYNNNILDVMPCPQAQWWAHREVSTLSPGVCSMAAIFYQSPNNGDMTECDINVNCGELWS